MISLFKKYQLLGLIILAINVFPLAAFSQAKKQVKSQSAASSSNTNVAASDKGVVINGVRWATCNVDAFGKFTASPEDMGKIYQWNRKKSWEMTGKITGWGGSSQKGNNWTKANDPSPAGWRVPTYEEIYKLLDTKKVTTKWTTQNGVKGRKFTDRKTGKSIFLPAAGCRNFKNGMFEGAGSQGYYWASNKPKGNNAYSTHFSEKFAQKNLNPCNYGFFIRPVAVE
ncbi:MAG: fibrobacter succinogenes major paralogous domain-containing protein [Prevotellaceae bacterium]|jgi:uncharacterized protein (TIGR02145 family)|nr:fibrobacter succinogenes major paralogous domain-containing protein [Prevotellaceae bacterium]